MITRKFLSAFVLGALGSAFLAPDATAQGCFEPDAGGTIILPPANCPYLSPAMFHVVVAGLPPGTEIIIMPRHFGFLGIMAAPGGALGGEIETFQSSLAMVMTGTGVLAGFNRVINMPVDCEVHTGPRVPGQPVQSFPTEMVALQGQIFGDPDFDFLEIRAGAGLGLPPSPGHTTLTLQPGGDWGVDSFFDITYEIDFQGAPGSILAGLGGSTTTASVTMTTPGGPIGTPYCVGAPNSVSPGGANIQVTGSLSVGANDLTLQAGPMPPTEFGVFFHGANQGMIPFGEGFLCAPGGIVRIWPPVAASFTGNMTRVLDNTTPAGINILAGNTRYFQSWYRDPAGGPFGFNLSNGVCLTFIP